MTTSNQVLERMASILNVTTEQLIALYHQNDSVGEFRFKDVVDSFLEDVNSRRVDNGLESVVVPAKS